jgi:hypothetical protein
VTDPTAVTSADGGPSNTTAPERRRHQQVSLGVVPAGSVVVGITLR